jgi:hypothetical protein
MLLIILALFWVALLAPVVVRRFRDNGTERSIQHFHAEHEVLSRQDYAVAPAHRLDQPDQDDRGANPPARRPRLTVVHADDTFGSLESRSSWEEWSEDYAFDDRGDRLDRSEAAPPPAQINHYAQAYAARPSNPVTATYYETPSRRTSMRVQRRRVFVGLLGTAIVLTAAGFVVGSSIVVDLAAIAWFAVVAFVALAFYAVSQGFLDESSLPLRLPQRRPLADVEPLYASGYEDEARYDDIDYGAEPEEQWSPPSQGRRAFG